MKILGQEIIDIAQSPKTTYAAATVTSGTGVSTFLGIIPNIIGTIAAIVGVIISILLWRKQNKKLNLEIKVLKKELENGTSNTPK